MTGLPRIAFRNHSFFMDGLDRCIHELDLPAATPLEGLPEAMATAGSPLGFSMLGVLERTFCRCGGRLCYDPVRKLAYMYHPEAGLWVEVAANHASQMIDDTLRYMEEVEIPLLNSRGRDAGKAVAKLIREYHNIPGKYPATLAYLANLRHNIHAAGESMFDSMDDLLLCSNGVADLRNNKVIPFAPEHMFRIASKTEFVPQFRCEMFSYFINHLVGGSKDPAGKLDYLQRVAGASLTGYSNDKLLVRLYDDTGDTGKTTLMEALATCLGDFCHVVEPQTIFGTRNDNNRAFAMAQLVGKRLVTMAETDADNTGFRMDTAAVKRFVGTDTQVARRPCEEPFSFQPKYTAWICTNGNTKISGGGDDAFWSRIKTIHFANKVTTKDTRFIEAARNPKSDFSKAVMSWAVEGAAKYFDYGLGTECIDIHEASEKYRKEVNVFAEFEEDLEFAPNYWVAANKLRELWSRHESTLEKKNAPSAEALLKDLQKRRGIVKTTMRVPLENGTKSKKAVKVWIGVRPKDREDAEYDDGNIPTSGELEKEE